MLSSLARRPDRGKEKKRERFPRAIDPARVGKYRAYCHSGGGFVWDDRAHIEWPTSNGGLNKLEKQNPDSQDKLT